MCVCLIYYVIRGEKNTTLISGYERSSRYMQCSLASGADLHTDLSSRAVAVDDMLLSPAMGSEGVEVD